MTSPATFEELLAPWLQVATGADAFFGRVARTAGAEMRCAPGCRACCGQQLTVVAAEGAALLAGLARASAAAREDARQRATRGAPCPLLVAERCALYAWRPIICRTHGLPILEAPPEAAADGPDHDVPVGREAGSTRGAISCCELNFASGNLPEHAVLDAALLTAQLTVADAIVREALTLERSLRVPIGALLADATAVATLADIRRRLLAADAS